MDLENSENLAFDEDICPSDLLAFNKAEFEINEPRDTFLKTTGFTKGFVIVNGFNLGRYYNAAGPQQTLYVPATVLKKGKNKLIVFELDEMRTPTVEFLVSPERSN